MKFTIAYYLMLLYVSVIVRPLVPFLTDAWSHEFNETEHVLLVHAKYGSHHVQKELAETNSDNDKARSENTVRSEDQAAVHIAVPACEYDRALNIVTPKHKCFKRCKPPLVCIANQAPPPKFSW